VRPRHLTGYLLAVSVVGLAALIAVLTHPDAVSVTARPLVVIPLALVIIVGELRPISVVRGSAEAEEVSISSTMGMAMLFLAPLGVVLATQAIALAIYEARTTKQRSQAGLRLTFNIGQYTLAFAAARGVYAGLTGMPFLTTSVHLSPADVPAAWVAALAFFLVNSGLTSTAIALSRGSRLPNQLRHDMRWQIASSSMLLGLAPVVAQAELWSPVLLPFLLFPIFVIHSSTTLAAKREHEALHDGLTGLPNRTLLMAHVDQLLQTRAEDTSVALLLLDLDHFKEVNDTLGHAVGDRLIREVGNRIRSVIEPSDMVARLGGDEFAVVAVLHADRTPADVARRLSTALNEPFIAETVMLDIGWSVGIATAPRHADTVDVLLQRADVAMYGAKETRGSFAIYDPERDQNSLQRLTLALDLRRAIELGELEVHFQPQVDARTLRPVGVEALVRWHHPSLGWIDPETIVALAASTGLIQALTEQVLDNSLAAASDWRRSGHHLAIAVNLMPRQLTDKGLPGLVATLLGRYDVPSDALVLEVTEATVMSDGVSTQSVLRALRAIGVRLSIDDFGTGYSSLAQLQALAPDEVKMDRSFVMAMHPTSREQVIVRSTIDLSHSLGMRVVAEGVETQATMSELQGLGCDVLQGFAIARPQDRDAISGWLANRPDDACTGHEHGRALTVVPLRESV
jgi:diguanylate cyclase (GGDEF)-like protein